MDIKGALHRLADGKDLTGTEMREVMEIVMSGDATPSQIGAFLMGMRVKGETVGEIAAAVSILRAKMVPVEAPEGAIDIVGTGGDGAGTLNISTGASIVVAAAGIPVAKHGNRALSSKSGSAEALQKLGISLELNPEQISTCIREAGIGFMFAPNHHPAMRHVGPARAEMGVRTMFNLLGPQANPAGVKRYLLGVYDNEWVEPVAAALLANQAQSAWVVHGDSGLDELSTTGPSFVSQIKGGNLTSFEVTPEEAGLQRATLSDIVGGDPAHNAAELRKLLDGAKGPYRDVVLLNAAAAFIICDRVETLREGVELGAQMVDSGKAKATLEKLIAVSEAV
jgi:anthranilate phosphoribosyltransferase